MRDENIHIFFFGLFVRSAVLKVRDFQLERKQNDVKNTAAKTAVNPLLLSKGMRGKKREHADCLNTYSLIFIVLCTQIL